MLAAVSLQAVEKALAKFSGPEVRSVVLGSERMRESADRATPSSNAPVVSKYLETYLANKKPSKEVADSLRATVRDFAAVVGDKPIDAYLPEDGTEFVSFLLTQPSNWMKIRELRALDVISAAKQAQALGLPCQAPNTIKKKTAQLRKLFKAGKGRHAGVQIAFSTDEVPSAGAANEARDPFEIRELQALFDSDLPENLRWISLISLYSGARCNEIAQLTRSRIREHDGTHYMAFLADMRLKNGTGSLRSVPIHSKLNELGFLDYVHSQSDQLFPGLTAHSSGRFSDALGKRFSYRLKLAGLKRPGLSFHSFRHTFIARMKVTAPRDTEVRERIVGHSIYGESGRYGAGYAAEAEDMDWLAVKAGVLETLMWPGLLLTRPRT